MSLAVRFEIACQRSMKLAIFICPTQHGHSSGSTSYTLLMSVAHVEIDPDRRLGSRRLGIDRRTIDEEVI